ncbi:ABC transporter substrate-binding protein [Paracraurococcus lichenis]|uniref:ABC transporter substrate-binding protein n=1 Tax=Paracraurococcus lichenis TaxID=3064888 RepID=A0ABT9E0S6_9PROT|nr:ABC transporter substrate-binding protein [Paracraurococcus sp. LOR1-02]MDO9709722.1 ABC transporter substrate-binding protein [Paracraurococcus sp. LOR1-02]
MRRRDLAPLLAALALPAGAAEPPLIRIGVLKFGTVAWELQVIARHGLAAANGIRIEAVELAGNEATRVALQARSVDVIVGDWLFVSRQRAEGQPLAFAPFSTAVAALMVPPKSSASSLRDLKGRRVGVSGGPLDKAWLLLVAEGRRQGIDLVAEAEPVFGAPPLLAEKLRRQEMEAALLYWNFAAALEAEGHRELLPIDAVERALGAAGPVAMIGHVFDERWAQGNRAAIDGFLRASGAAKAILAEKDAEWEALRPLMRAESEAAFLRLRDRFRSGIPRRPVQAEEADAARLYAVVAELGGPRLVGRATTLSPGTFWRASE